MQVIAKEWQNVVQLGQAKDAPLKGTKTGKDKGEKKDKEIKKGKEDKKKNVNGK